MPTWTSMSMSCCQSRNPQAPDSALGQLLSSSISSIASPKNWAGTCASRGMRLAESARNVAPRPADYGGKTIWLFVSHRITGQPMTTGIQQVSTRYSRPTHWRTSHVNRHLFRPCKWRAGLPNPVTCPRSGPTPRSARRNCPASVASSAGQPGHHHLRRHVRGAAQHHRRTAAGPATRPVTAARLSNWLQTDPCRPDGCRVGMDPPSARAGQPN